MDGKDSEIRKKGTREEPPFWFPGYIIVSLNWIVAPLVYIFYAKLTKNQFGESTYRNITIVSGIIQLLYVSIAAAYISLLGEWYLPIIAYLCICLGVTIFGSLRIENR